MKNRIVSIVVCITVLLGVIARADAGTVLTPETGENIPGGYIKKAETENLELYYNESIYSFIVKDKRNGCLWCSSVDESYYNMENTNNLWKQNMSSMFYINYTSDYKKINSSNNIAQESKVSTRPIEKGIAIKYDLTKLSIRFTIEIWLDNNSVNVRIPAESIEEYGNNCITSIELLPFLGAASDYETGYVFYPDGCGGLYHFKGKPELTPEKYSWPVYGYDKLDLDEIEKREKAGLEQALLPVFGLKKGDNAFIAIITKGDHDTYINFYPSGFAVNLTRINAELIYRRTHKDLRPYATITNYIEKEMFREDHEIKYVFLAGNDANYSGMASVYRQYLEKESQIRRTDDFSGSMPLWLDLFMGIILDQVLFDKYIKMTTFDNAIEILEAFKNRGIDIYTNLIGWVKGGYRSFPANWPPERALGGINGIRKLAEYSKNNDIKLFLENNFIDALDKNWGFSKRNDVAYQRNGLSVTDKRKEKYILNPVKAYKRFAETLIPKIKNIPISGLSFDRLGKFIYFDYHKDYPVSRSQAAEQWAKIMEVSREKTGGAVVRGGNAYILKYADWLLDIPVKDSGYFLTDELIPFYQMVVHGYIPYSANAGNLFHDFKRQKLKWVEYGCMPYFKLTYQESVLLLKTEYNHLFTSCYLYWIDTAVDIYEEFNQRIGDLWTEIIVSHEKIGDDIYKVTYGNGSRVYINYNESPVHVDSFNIKEMDYIVVDKEGKVK